MAKSRAQRPTTAVVALAIAVVVAIVVVVVVRSRWSSESSTAQSGFDEPVRLSSKDGVLEVRLTARQASASLDTVDQPVDDFLLFGYELVQGTSSDGKRSADSTYPGPTLHVSPGETLVVHLANELSDLTLEDLYDPSFTSAGQTPPLYPPQLADAPFNLHTHGLHVSPNGNSDNVLLDIPNGSENTYTYRIPSDHPQGMYWYHSHRHMLTAPETYTGLAGMLEIGRPDGDIPVVTQNDLPIRTMALQYNYVFDRKGGLSKLNNVNWPQYVSTLQEPEGTQLADGTYEPLLTPVNFADSAAGTQYFTNWYAGQLSVNNDRGQFQFLPSSLQGFTPDDADPAQTIAVDTALPDDQRDVQFTVNGNFQPTVQSKAGQTEIWVLANVSDFAYMNLTLTETATGNHPSIAIVAQDGNPYEQVQYPAANGGTTLLMPPATRYAIAVTIPETGDLVLEMPPMQGLTEPMTSPGILYTADGTDRPPAVLGTVTVPPASISYTDGFFTSPTQVLARAVGGSGQGVTVPFTQGQDLDAYTSFLDTRGITPAVERELVVTGGFDNMNASNEDPLAFVYQFDDNAFPYIPLLQPRLGTVEEWTFVNRNNDQHPIHIHVNDFQVAQVVDPVAGTTVDFQPWGQDNANLPAPAMDADGNVTAPGVLKVRTKFQQFTGTYVVHCHRLNHEDNGLMAIINVIPAVSTYAVATPGAPGRDATVEIRDGADDRPLTTLTPFPGFEGLPTVAMGDLDGDGVFDAVVGAGAGAAPEVVAYSGASSGADGLFTNELARFEAFEHDFQGGVNVAVATIDGEALAANIVVGSGPGVEGEVKVFDSALPGEVGRVPGVFSTFTPYAGDRTGVAVAAGMVDFVSGRQSIVTAPGPGSPARVQVYRYDLYTSTGSSTATTARANDDVVEPALITDFLAFDESYTGGVSLATGWLAGAEGGAQRIVVGQLGAPGQVKVFSSGSSLDGEPAFYTVPLSQHSHSVSFEEVASFAPMGNTSGGVRVATTSTVYGADLLVSGVGADGSAVVQKFFLSRAPGVPKSLVARLLGSYGVPLATGLPALGGG